MHVQCFDIKLWESSHFSLFPTSPGTGVKWDGKRNRRRGEGVWERNLQIQRHECRYKDINIYRFGNAPSLNCQDPDHWQVRSPRWCRGQKPFCRISIEIEIIFFYLNQNLSVTIFRCSSRNSRWSSCSYSYLYLSHQSMFHRTELYIIMDG